MDFAAFGNIVSQRQRFAAFMRYWFLETGF
jgi:hypothetical protein